MIINADMGINLQNVSLKDFVKIKLFILFDIKIFLGAYNKYVYLMQHMIWQ